MIDFYTTQRGYIYIYGEDAALNAPRLIPLTKETQGGGGSWGPKFLFPGVLTCKMPLCYSVFHTFGCTYL